MKFIGKNNKKIKMEELYEISHIDFGIYSADEIKKMAVCEIYSSRFGEDPKKHKNEDDSIYIYDENKLEKTQINTVYDERMGPLDHKQNCQSCGMNFYACPGHFGYIELSIPIIHPLFVKSVSSYLKCICLNSKCNRLLITREQVYLNKFQNYTRENRFKKILDHLEKVDLCSHCNSPQPQVSHNVSDSTISINYKNKEGPNLSIVLSVDEMQDHLENIPDEDIELLGFDPKKIHPKNLILTVLPVLPTCSRPPVMADGNICDDDLTLQYTEIIKANNHLKNKQLSDTKRATYIQTLKFRIKTLMNNSQGKAKHTTNHRPIKCFHSRLSGKEGQIRNNILGKRGNQAARSVIGPAPELRSNEIGVPREIAENLTIPENVAHFNKEYLTDLVNSEKANYILRTTNGKEKRIDLKYALFTKHTPLLYGDIIYRNNKEILVKDYTKHKLIYGDKIKRNGKFLEEVKLRERKKFNLEVGDVVERHLKNGDVVMLNRQPTLWKGSMRSQKVVVGKFKTLRFNLAITKPMNADFDGDEANISCGQSPESRAELYELSETSKIMMSAQSSSSSIAIVQDSLLGAYLMTKGLVRISKHEFFNICMKGDELENQVVGEIKGWNPERILKGIQHIRRTLKSQGKSPIALSGKGLISLMLPIGFFYKMKNEASEEEPIVKIYDGVLIEGTLNKKILGTSSNSLIQVLHKEYGKEVAINFVDNIQFITNAWLQCEGFSIGIEDCIVTKTEEIENIISSALFEAESIKETTLLPGIREMRISNCLSNARNEGLKIAQNSLRKNNNFISTVTSGSKGDWPNLMQITGTLGQQNLSGSRIKAKLNHNKRTLPHYPWKNISIEQEYESKGFITSSFIKGLSPREFISHAYCSRDGIIHTAISTSISGYSQRKIINSCEDLQVKYDGTVRNAAGTIFQMTYAEDNFNREEMVRVNGNLEVMDVGRIIKRLNFAHEKKRINN